MFIRHRKGDIAGAERTLARMEAEASAAQRPADDSASGAAEQLAQANRHYNQALRATETGEFAAASDLYSQALAIREAVYGRESNVAAQTLFAMGSASLLAERPSAAAAHYRSAAAAYGVSSSRESTQLSLW